jgi:uncharacterized protein
MIAIKSRIRQWQIPILLVASTLLILLDFYEKVTPWKFVDRIIFHLLIPLVIILLVFGEKPSEYGFQIGDWRTGLKLTLLSALVVLPVLWLANRYDPSLRPYYLPHYSPLAPLTNLVDMLGWEFQFRGWLLFGLAHRFGKDALWMQAVPFAIAHMGKPELETLTTIFGGYFFGWVAWKTRSYFYPVLIHWCIATGIIFVSAGWFG